VTASLQKSPFHKCERGFGAIEFAAITAKPATATPLSGGIIANEFQCVNISATEAKQI
jgi:hypothetical protein